MLLKKPVVNLTNTDYLNVLDSFEHLTDVGLIPESSSEYQERRKNLESRYEEFKTCCEWIEMYKYHPSKREFLNYVQLQTYNSYYLKHLVEKWAGKYISNGAFIAALKFLKIPFRPIYGTPDVSVTIFLKKKATLL